MPGGLVADRQIVSDFFPRSVGEWLEELFDISQNVSYDGSIARDPKSYRILKHHWKQSSGGL